MAAFLAISLSGEFSVADGILPIPAAVVTAYRKAAVDRARRFDVDAEDLAPAGAPQRFDKSRAVFTGYCLEKVVMRGRHTWPPGVGRKNLRHQPAAPGILDPFAIHEICRHQFCRNKLAADVPVRG